MNCNANTNFSVPNKPSLYVIESMHCHFVDIVDDVLKDVPIDVDTKIFELGCGTGAVLKRIRCNHPWI